MIAAAREGRLLLMPKEHKQPKREDVLNSVRAYVSEIECFARRGWEGLILKQYLEECSSWQIWDVVGRRQTTLQVIERGPYFWIKTIISTSTRRWRAYLRLPRNPSDLEGGVQEVDSQDGDADNAASWRAVDASLRNRKKRPLCLFSLLSSLRKAIAHLLIIFFIDKRHISS